MEAYIVGKALGTAVSIGIMFAIIVFFINQASKARRQEANLSIRKGFYIGCVAGVLSSFLGPIGRIFGVLCVISCAVSIIWWGISWLSRK